jgi:hypothetical protein
MKTEGLLLKSRVMQPAGGPEALCSDRQTTMSARHLRHKLLREEVKAVLTLP